ncbi:MAG: hypothetical protein COU69_02770 [Candidatus Pacebacteria bacterium CG10_big_fil_rev_8_21_14_0_10_56_10]|nr:MAG: hypothetical protein COU69_02770 [Candidatus Pacebacteria bacterium CG10_big_fil_rev_8_21_14_0_10_56_10]
MIVLVILSTIGLVNALALYWQYRLFRQTNRPMFCLIGEDCSRVVGSRYGATFGIKNDLLGAVYYAAVIGLAGAAQVFPELTPTVGRLMVVTIVPAAALSLYLFYIQARVLRSWCSWCLIGIGLNALMAMVAITTL